MACTTCEQMGFPVGDPFLFRQGVFYILWRECKSTDTLYQASCYRILHGWSLQNSDTLSIIGGIEMDTWPFNGHWTLCFHPMHLSSFLKRRISHSRKVYFCKIHSILYYAVSSHSFASMKTWVNRCIEIYGEAAVFIFAHGEIGQDSASYS